MSSSSIFPFSSWTNYLRNKGIVTPAPTETAPIGTQLSSSSVNDPLLTRNQTNLSTQPAPQIQEPSAIDRVKRIMSQQPTREAYEPSTGRKVLGGLVGFFGGLKNPAQGAEMGKAVVNDPYNTAYSDWSKKLGATAKEVGLEQSQEKVNTAEDRAKSYQQLNEGKVEDLEGKARLSDAKVNDLGNKMPALELKLKNNLDKINAQGNTAEDLKRMTLENSETLKRIDIEQRKLHDQMLERLNTANNNTKGDIAANKEKGLNDRNDNPKPKINSPLKPQEVERANEVTENEMFRTAQPQDQSLFEPIQKKSVGGNVLSTSYRLLPSNKVPPTQIAAWRRLVMARDTKVNGAAPEGNYTVEEVK